MKPRKSWETHLLSHQMSIVGRLISDSRCGFPRPLTFGDQEYSADIDSTEMEHRVIPISPAKRPFGLLACRLVGWGIRVRGRRRVSKSAGSASQRRGGRAQGWDAGPEGQSIGRSAQGEPNVPAPSAEDRAPSLGGLKPQVLWAFSGAAKAAPFQKPDSGTERGSNQHARAMARSVSVLDEPVVAKQEPRLSRR